MVFVELFWGWGVGNKQRNLQLSGKKGSAKPFFSSFSLKLAESANHCEDTFGSQKEVLLNRRIWKRMRIQQMVTIPTVSVPELVGPRTSASTRAKTADSTLALNNVIYMRTDETQRFFRITNSPREFRSQLVS